jgi:hypothetical protein
LLTAKTEMFCHDCVEDALNSFNNTSKNFVWFFKIYTGCFFTIFWLLLISVPAPYSLRTYPASSSLAFSFLLFFLPPSSSRILFLFLYFFLSFLPMHLRPSISILPYIFSLKLTLSSPHSLSFSSGRTSTTSSDLSPPSPAVVLSPSSSTSASVSVLYLPLLSLRL